MKKIAYFFVLSVLLLNTGHSRAAAMLRASGGRLALLAAGIVSTAHLARQFMEFCNNEQRVQQALRVQSQAVEPSISSEVAQHIPAMPQPLCKLIEEYAAEPTFGDFFRAKLPAEKDDLSTGDNQLFIKIVGISKSVSVDVNNSTTLIDIKKAIADQENIAIERLIIMGRYHTRLESLMDLPASAKWYRDWYVMFKPKERE